MIYLQILDIIDSYDATAKTVYYSRKKNCAFGLSGQKEGGYVKSFVWFVLTCDPIVYQYEHMYQQTI